MSTYLLDTNVVVRLLEPSAPEHTMVRDALRRLWTEGHSLVLASQVLVELWVVATRPLDVNGFGWEPGKVGEAISALRQQFGFLDERPEVFERWLSLVMSAQVRGKRSHDARLAALALSHGVTDILTLNTADYAGLTGIRAIRPSSA